MNARTSAFDVNIPASRERQCFISNRSASLGGRVVVPSARNGMTSMAASEMHKLTFAQRESVYDDLHAVSRPQEDSLDITKAISEVKAELTSIRLKPAYNKALFLNREYVDDRSFFLMFLRSTKFDTKVAAQRIVDHFKYKLELFGPEMLGRDLLYGDLDGDTKQALNSGAFQVPRSRDSAGRAIVFLAFDHLRYKDVDCQLRAAWYMLMCALKDPETQKNGTVHISYNVSYISKTLHLDLLLKSSMVVKSMPQRILGVHFCYNSDILHPLLSTIQLIVGASARLRLRSHYGSYLETMYSLKAFGIPSGALPLDTDGNLSSITMVAFIKEAIKEDEQIRRELGGKIMHPLSADVLLGRGWHQQEHPGNLKLARIVDDHRTAYKSARKRHKINLNWRIVEIIRDSGGRFLERSQGAGGGWVEAGDANARDKVSKCFRTKTRQNSTFMGIEDESGSATSSSVANEANPLDVPSSSASRSSWEDQTS